MGGAACQAVPLPSSFPKSNQLWAGQSFSLMEVLVRFDTRDELAQGGVAGQDAVFLLCRCPEGGLVCWWESSEEVRDYIVRVSAIDQSSSIVMDEPAGDLCPVSGVLAVVFLQASGDRQVSWGHS